MGVNETIARRWFREVWSSGGEPMVDQLLAPRCEGWMEGRFVSCPAEFKEARRELLAVFPDFQIAVDDTVEQGDKVVVRWSAQGTHAGDGLGVAPTNRPVSFRGMTWLEIRDGLIVRGWDSWNLGGLIQTLRDRQPA